MSASRLGAVGALGFVVALGCAGMLGLDDERPARDAICEPVDSSCPKPPDECRTRVDAASVEVIGVVASRGCDSLDACLEMLECLAEAGISLCTPLLEPCDNDAECCSWASGDLGGACGLIGDETDRYCTHRCDSDADCPGGSCFGDVVGICRP